MKSSPLTSSTSPFLQDPEYPLYLYGAALVYSARMPALLLWMALNAVVLVRNFAGPELLFLLSPLKILCVVLMVLCGLMVFWAVKRPALRHQVDQQMREDMLYRQKKNQSMHDFSRSHLAQLLGKVGTFTTLHLLVIQLCALYLQQLG